jgi:hypothetical protein
VDRGLREPVSQALAAVGAGFGVPRVGTAAIEAGSRAGGSGGAPRDFDELFSLTPIKKIEGKKNDQKEEDPDGPEEALHESVPVLLGVKENPHGDDQWNHVKKDKKETHSGFSRNQHSAGTANIGPGSALRIRWFCCWVFHPKLETRNPKPIF